MRNHAVNNDEIFETGISEEVYHQNYRYGDDRTVADTWKRNATALASVEENDHHWTKKFYNLLSGRGLPTGPFPFTPGGRIFANAGTELGKASLINCLSGETQVLTRQGRRPIEDLAGGTHTVLTEGGKWVEAPIQSFGVQPLRKITLTRNGQERVIYATPNHEWIVTTKSKNGYKRVTTDELKEAHRIKQVRSSIIEDADPDQKAVARGFTFGDGSVSSTPKADLVAEKAEDMRPYFDAEFGKPNEYRIEGNRTLRYSGMPESWSEVPIDVGSSPDELLGWAAGYFAADGCVSQDGEVIMDSCTRSHVERFIEVMEVLGVNHYGLKKQVREGGTNLTDETSIRYYVRLDPRDLSATFFLRSKHQQRFLSEGDRELNYHWTVSSVEKTDRVEEVYCAEVPETHSFVLSEGILTSNCFVSGSRGRDQDSMDEIQAELTRQAKILASEGGYGFCASFMRPRGGRIGGVGSMTPGAVQMLDTWNTQAATIVAGSGMKSDRDDVKNKIRKGAQMVTMHVWHPDVIEFIKAKQEPGRLHKFNMSLMVSDEFMKAVRHDEKWALRYPAYEEEPEFYRENWDGNLQAYEDAGGTVKVWRDPETGEKQIYDAREIWDLITRSTYERNEPGVLFYDTINKENNLNYCEHIDSTNPCVTGDTRILTRDGHHRIQALVGQEVEVWNGHEWSKVTPKVTGEDQPILEVSLNNGATLSCTPDHDFLMADGRKVKASELENGDKIAKKEMPVIEGEGEIEDPYTQGFYAGDGQSERDQGALLYGEKQEIKPRLATPSENELLEGDREYVNFPTLDRPRFYVPTNKSLQTRLDWLAGLMDADGTVNRQTNSLSVQITTNREDFAEEIRLMLTGMGVRAKISFDGRTESDMPDGNGGMKTYDTKPTYRILINAVDMNHLVDLGLETERLDLSDNNPQRDARRFVKVESVGFSHFADKVYCFTEAKRHLGTFNGIVTGQCGEQVLPPGGVCLLGNFNLTQFLTEDYSGFDFDLLEQLVPSAVRFLDNVNDLSYVPTELQEKNLQQKRRIGLGHYGDGSALMMMGVRYGSEEGFRTMRQFQEKLANLAYQASARLAKEKEPFPLFDRDHYLNEAPFVQRLSSKTKEMIAAHGLRNSHLLSIQPTGNTSTLANAPSSGIEPVFMFSYTRTSEQPSLPDEVDRPEVIDHDSGIISGANAEQWEIEEQGDENIARCVVEGHTEWQIHPTRGIVKDSVVEDYGVRRLKERGEWDPDAHWAVTTRDLEVDDHITQMKALAPFVDSAMSKTINVPNDYPFEDFQEVYTKAHRTGVIKGVTTYRAGTMSAVLSSTDDEGEEDGVPTTDAPERPEELDCNIYRVRYSGDRWKIFVGHLDGDPYEVFARPPQKTYPRITDSSGKAIDKGTIRKVESGHYQLIAPDGKVVIENIAEDTTDDEVKEQTRLVSTALRHGTPLHYIVKQLEKAEGSIASFGRAMAKALKQETDDLEVTCDACGSANVKHVEGCLTCQECGHSKCS